MVSMTSSPLKTKMRQGWDGGGLRASAGSWYLREILVPSTRLACFASAPVALKLGFSLLTGAPPYFVGAWSELSTPRKETSWSGRGFLLRWCGERDRLRERLRRRRLGGGDLEADGERVRCLRSRMASLSSLDLSLSLRRRSRERERERERSRLLCLCFSLCLSLSCERSRSRSRLRLPSVRWSRVRSPCFPTERSRLLLSRDPSRRLFLSLEPSLRRSLDVSRLLSRDRLRSRDSSRRFLYGSGDPSRPGLLEVAAAVAVAVAAGEASLGLRSLERSLCLLSRDLLLDLRREATEGSLLARPTSSSARCSGSGSLLGLSVSLPARSATTRGGVGTSPLASC
ncbi:hypothetical protein B5807_08361 [Epicoccum nigrum]|uniref:Uncharacterized protein n=1 Tax=Epicoccum nigrum TaxID=105696 RepID=A0A1Y2LQU8_EPING|nr:hypothetical protein B5807_08361 [Epicoccum nigrum]